MSDELKTETADAVTKPTTAEMTFDPFDVPIAARLPAERGWRAILLEPGETDKMLRIVVVAIEHWALDAPAIDMRKTGHHDLRAVFAVAGAGTYSTGLWPIHPITGKRVGLNHLYALVPPCETTSEALLGEASKHLHEADKAIAAEEKEEANP